MSSVKSSPPSHPPNHRCRSEVGGDGRSAPRDDFLHMLAQVEVRPLAAGCKRPQRGRRQRRSGGFRARTSQPRHRRKATRPLEHNFRSRRVRVAEHSPGLKNKAFIELHTGTSSRVWHGSAYRPASVAHMQPPTPCLWHCCPVFNPTPIFQREEEGVTNHFPRLFLISESLVFSLKLKLTLFSCYIHQHMNITKAPWIILSVYTDLSHCEHRVHAP